MISTINHITFKTGDLVTLHHYTDSDAVRIIDVQRNGKEVVFQEDFAILYSSFKPNMVPGGFSAHCTNQNEQKYSYSPNPNGRITTVTLRSWNGVKIWTEKDATPNGRSKISHGQRKFYDYNF